MLSAPEIEKYFENNPSFDLRLHVAETLQRLGIVKSTREVKDGSRDGLQDHHTHDQTLMTDFNSEIVVTVNKSDLGQIERLKDAVGGSTPFQICLISCTRQEGIHEILDVLKCKIEKL
jgi:signal recognition particle receptor subunit beta